MADGASVPGARPIANSPRRTPNYLGASPLVIASIQRDLAEYPEADEAEDDADTVLDDDESNDSETGAVLPRPRGDPVEMSTSYRRGSFITAGNRATVLPSGGWERAPHRSERHEAWREERSLLRDNNLIPPKHPQQGDGSGWTSRVLTRHTSLGVPGGSRRVVAPDSAEAAVASTDSLPHPSEETPLIGDPDRPYGGLADDAEELEHRWMEAVKAGRIKTTWQRELKVIARYTVPLIFTFLLTYSLVLSSMLAIGHLGTIELGAISLGTMSANITGYTLFQGLATACDTLCSQAYGSGRKKLVGLQLQRMVYFLWICCIPVGILWFCSPYILNAIVPEPEVAVLAGRYLRVVLIGLPPFAAFEGGKRFLQAQGIFSASLYVLIVVAPINAFLNWYFIWHLHWGFIGAPIATIISNYMLALGLFGYVCFINGSQCWPGFTTRALHNWGPMIRLALPGLLMVQAEVLAFEILTLASSYFGTAALAANSVLAQASTLTWQLPFPLSIATSTRVANLIGATLSDAAKTSAKAGMSVAVCIGFFNLIVLSSAKDYIPRAFSSDPEVWERASAVLPLCAAFQLFDALAANCNGILRGLGRQEIGGYIQLLAYYVVAMPVSFGTAFGAGWGLEGLWTGVAIALALVVIVESIFISRVDWERSVEEALRRNEDG